MVIKRGDLFYADLNGFLGSEQGGTRPILVIQNNVGNKYSPTVVVAPITAKQGKPKLPTHIKIDSTDILPKDSVVLLEQIRTIDKQRLGEYIGFLDKKIMADINKGIGISVGLNKKYL